MAQQLDVNVAKSFLRRLKKIEIISLLKEWTAINVSDERLRSLERLSKMQLVAKIIRVCQDKGVTDGDIAELDLLNLAHNPKGKTWCIFKFDSLHVDNNSQDSLTACQFAEKLKENTRHYFKACVTTKIYKKGIWVRLYPDLFQTYVPTNVVYMVHYPQTHFVGIANLKSATQDFIIQALSDTLLANKGERLLLKGKCVASLMQMAINHELGGTIPDFEPDIQEPSWRSSRRKRKADEVSEMEDDRISDEKKKQKIERIKHLDKLFGNKLPVLEKLEYALVTRFGGHKFVQEMAHRDKNFSCSVKFEGSSVLEGIKNLAKAGLIDLPLSRHLSQVPYLGKNQFVLRNKTRSQQTPSSCGN